MGESYCRIQGPYDEMCADPHEIRAHWRTYMTALQALGPQEVDRRWEQALRVIRENGMTYNVYGDPLGIERPWQLDPAPLLIAPPDWAFIESALVQRATLLNLIMVDLHGPQRLLSESLLPPELVFASQHFLRACHGIEVAQQRYLHLYSADLARSPDGQWWVLSDRTQAPSGAGYALENRVVLSRVFPNIFRSCGVQRLATFFRTLQLQLLSLAPRNRENPRIVLLTPGPYNESYFEHAYLARYLGYTLVEGGDLTVRDNGVYLKTLGGLRQVDVILRRVDDVFCDPLELRSDSSLGVPGLLEVVRQGNVTVANALGSGLLETSAIMAFLPNLCRALLGEDLKMPSMATWWCGQESERNYVLDHLSELVIKPAFPADGMNPIFGDRLDKKKKQELAERIRAQPERYVGQERVTLSTSPVWGESQLQPRPLVLRSFLTADAGSYMVMPGGLTRVAASTETSVVSMQSGGGSKDTWVLADGPVPEMSLLRPTEQVMKLTRGAYNLPSRVADNLFWLGRYVERAEDLVRLFRTVLSELSYESGRIGNAESLPLLRPVYVMGYLDESAFQVQGPPEERFDEIERALLAVLVETDRSNGLRTILGRLRDLAWLVRDRISMDTWRILNRLDQYLYVTNQNAELRIGDGLAMLDGIIITLAAFSGVGDESMTRGQSWRFLDLGRRIERGLHMIDLLRSTLVYPSNDEGPLLDSLLNVADSAMTYRSRYMAAVQAGPVLDLLLMDETNPRALGFQMAAMTRHVDRLPNTSGAGQRSTEQKLMIQAISRLRLADVTELVQIDDMGVRASLELLLGELRTTLPDLSNAITRNYLSHTQSTRNLAIPRGQVNE